MRNAVTLGVSQARLDLFRRDFKLFCDFSGADAVIEVIDDDVNRHPCTAQYRSAALHSRLDFDERALRPVNFLHGGHSNHLINIIPCFHFRSPSSALKTFGLRTLFLAARRLSFVTALLFLGRTANPEGVCGLGHRAGLICTCAIASESFEGEFKTVSANCTTPPRRASLVGRTKGWPTHGRALTRPATSPR
jgi:hypothetical protein